jgi:hypothetical protein
VSRGREAAEARRGEAFRGTPGGTDPAERDPKEVVMKKLIVIPLAAAFAFSVAPAWADSETETRTEERVEQKRDAFGDLETTRSVETHSENEDGDERTARTVQKEESVDMGGLGTVKKKTETRTEVEDD